MITQFISRLRQGKPPVIYGDGEASRDFVYVKNAVEACMLVLECKNCAGQVVNIGTGKPTKINELAKMLVRMFEKTSVEPEYAPSRPGRYSK